MDVGHYIREVESLLKQREIDAAIELLSVAMETWPDDRELTSAMAHAHALAGDYCAAIADLDKMASQAEVLEPWLLFDRGRFNHLTDQLSASEADFRLLIAVEQAVGQSYYSAMAHFFLAAVLLDQGRANDAADELDHVPNDIQTYHGRLGLISFSSLRDRCERMQASRDK